MSQYTQRYNINRGYIKLDVWKKSIKLFKLVNELFSDTKTITYKLKNQVLDSTQSISSNIAEGYCRRHLNEYIQYLYIALGSTGETITRIIGLKVMEFINDDEFDNFDELHYEVENKLIALLKSLEKKRDNKEWSDRINEDRVEYLHNDIDS